MSTRMAASVSDTPISVIRRPLGVVGSIREAPCQPGLVVKLLHCLFMASLTL